MAAGEEIVVDHRIPRSPRRPRKPWSGGPARTVVLGVPVDCVTIDVAIERLLTVVTNWPPRQVVTVTPEFVMLTRKNSDFKRVILNADLAVADGIGVVLASRLLGTPVPERIGGIDLVERYAAAAAPKGSRLCLLGARDGVAEGAARSLPLRFPGLCLVGA